MIELTTPAEIARMHVTGRFVAEALTEVGRLADVGVTPIAAARPEHTIAITDDAALVLTRRG